MKIIDQIDQLRKCCEVDDVCDKAAAGVVEEFKQHRRKVLALPLDTDNKLRVLDALRRVLKAQLIVALEFCQVKIPDQLRLPDEE